MVARANTDLSNDATAVAGLHEIVAAQKLAHRATSTRAWSSAWS